MWELLLGPLFESIAGIFAADNREERRKAFMDLARYVFFIGGTIIGLAFIIYGLMHLGF